MFFETLTSSGSLLNTGFLDKNIFIKQECYPDDWCRPDSGSECGPGPTSCYPTQCTPERDGDCNPKVCNPDKCKPA